MDLIIFYFFAGVFFWVLLAYRTSSILRGLTLSLAIILIGSEYYEIPIFFCRYFGFLNYRFPSMLTILNHLLIIIVFALYLSVSKLKMNKINVTLLILGPLFTAPFLFLHDLYFARAIGLTTLFSVTYGVE